MGFGAQVSEPVVHEYLCLRGAREYGEARSKEVAEKVRQASQSNQKKSENLEAGLNNLLLATKKCGWAKGQGGHGATVGREEVKPWKEKKTEGQPTVIPR